MTEIISTLIALLREDPELVSAFSAGFAIGFAGHAYIQSKANQQHVLVLSGQMDLEQIAAKLSQGGIGRTPQPDEIQTLINQLSEKLERKE